MEKGIKFGYALCEEIVKRFSYVARKEISSNSFAFNHYVKTSFNFSQTGLYLQNFIFHEMHVRFFPVYDSRPI